MTKSIKILSSAGVVIISLLFITCNNSQQKSSDNGTNQEGADQNVYACPMHPEITGKPGDKCSKCGMELQKKEKDNPEDIQVAMTSLPQTIEAGKPAQLSFSITENGKNAILETQHEKKIHLIIVDESLTWFHHIHTLEQADGNYTAIETFPYSGKYFLYIDFKVSDLPGTVNKKEIEVAGNVAIKPDTASKKLVSKVDGYTIKLENGNNIKSNEQQLLNFTIEKDLKMISAKNIQPYLGAIAHIVLISKADKEFLHIHPSSTETYPVQGETYFEKAGIYRMWVQFQIDGKVTTADFTIQVSEGEDNMQNPSQMHEGHQHS